MPLPLIVGAAALAAGIAKKASNKMKLNRTKDELTELNKAVEWSYAALKDSEAETQVAMDCLGIKEIEIVASFKPLVEYVEKIQNIPKSILTILIEQTGRTDISYFLTYYVNNADDLLQALVGARLGTAGGFAMRGDMGGCIIVPCYRKSHLQEAMIGHTAFEMSEDKIFSGLSIGALPIQTKFPFEATADNLDTVFKEALIEFGDVFDVEVHRINALFEEIKSIAEEYRNELIRLHRTYLNLLGWLAILLDEKTDWTNFSEREQSRIEELVALVATLYNLCSIAFFIEQDDIKVFNASEIQSALELAKSVKV